ncbi:MAG: ABC transporter substrate-binding protein, partial [Acidimicrobiales bacterium]
LVAGCSSGSDGRGRAGRAASSTSTAAGDPVPGGSARVGVWGEPDPAAPTLGGAAVRSLVLPQLYVARPDGRWQPSLVVGGSDRTGPLARSATLRLRSGTWSDGSPITVEDLRRSADDRFVAGIDGPAPDGTLTLRFTQSLPGWRRLWSGVDSVSAPAPNVWGGPFVVAGYERGLEVVLRRNDGWYGEDGPFLDELRLVLVPDPTIARLLLGKGELDAVMPPAGTVRTTQLRAVAGVEVATAPSSQNGWWVGLVFGPERLSLDRRRAVMALVDRRPFVETLLADEATVLDGFDPSGGGAGPGPWSRPGAGDARALRGATVDLVGEYEEPMTGLVQRSMQKRARAVAGQLELRNAEADRVEPWVAAGAFDAAVVMQLDGPVVCWTCRWSAVDEGLARAADAGDAAAASALQTKLRDDARLLPLWRTRTVVAWRSGLRGVVANGYALSAAWNAWEWSRAGE